MIPMIRVVEVTMTCPGVPAQWEGHTDDDRALYVHYRHGWLNVSVSGPGGTVDEAIDAQLGTGAGAGQHVITAHVGGEYDGFMSAAELRDHTDGVIEWPYGFAS